MTGMRPQMQLQHRSASTCPPRRVGTAASILLPLLLLLLPLVTATAAPTVLHTRVPSGWRVAAPAPLEQPHRVTIALHQRNVDQLQRRLSQLSDPTHAVYGQWMSKAEVDDLIAPPASVVSTVTAWVQSAGISSSSITHHGDALEVVTTVGHVNALFSTSLHTFEQQGSGKRSVVAHNISMPEHVAPHVQMLLGVHNFPFPIKHSAHVISGTAHTTSSSSSSTTSRFRPFQTTPFFDYPIMVPRDLAAYYGFPDNTQFVRPAHYRANTSIAVAQFDEPNVWESIRVSDIGLQGLLADVPGIQTNPVIVGDNNQAYPSQEASKGIQAVTANNPLTNASHWEENSTGWIYSICLQLLAVSSVPQILSISYGIEEQLADVGGQEGITGGYTVYITATEIQLMKLAALGVSVIVSSGNNGANGDGNTACVYTNAYPSSLYVSWPASSPHVTAVGATELDGYTSSISEANTPWCGMASGSLPSGFGYDSSLATPFQLQCVTNGTEVAAGRGFRSGGGFSRYYAQPSWQSAAVAGYLSKAGINFPWQTYYDTSKRAVPDVAMYGAGIGVVMGSNVIVLGGTGLAAPLFAVIVSLLNQVSLTAGGSTLGLLNPLLYYMAANVSGTFKDITSGDNRMTEECIVSSTCSGANPCGCAGCQGFTATTGWDPVTGLGSPVYSRVAAFIKQLAQGSSFSSTAAAVSSSARSSSSSTAPPTVASSTAAPTSAPATPSSTAFPATSARATSTPATSAPATSAPATSAPAITSAPATSAQSRSSSSPSSTAPSITSPSPPVAPLASSVLPSTHSSSSSSAVATTVSTSSSTSGSSESQSSGAEVSSSSDWSLPLSASSSSPSMSLNDTASSASSNHSTAIIAGSVAGGVVLLLLLLCCVVLCACCRREGKAGVALDALARTQPASSWSVRKALTRSASASSVPMVPPRPPAAMRPALRPPSLPPRPSKRQEIRDPYADVEDEHEV